MRIEKVRISVPGTYDGDSWWNARKYPAITTLSPESGNVIKWLLLLFSIQKFVGLNLDPETQYLEDFLHSLIYPSKCYIRGLN
jgi:hypothetical protein